MHPSYYRGCWHEVCRCAKKLQSDGKVYSQEAWENHEIQREIAKPNIDNRKQKLNTYGANFDETTLGTISHNGKFVNYSNTFFRDFFDVLIKDSKHKDWFAPKS